MYEFDLTTVGGFLSAMWYTAGGVLKLDPAIFKVAVTLPNMWMVALAILFVAGMLDMLGQSMVLFANRVTPRRFVVSLLMSGLMLIVSAFVYALTIWLFVRMALRFHDTHFSTVLILVALSYAPLLFGVFSLFPYLGNLIYHAVRVWSLLALVVGVAAISDSAFWLGLLACLIGWLFMQFIIHMPLFKIKAIDAWLWRVMTGTSQRLDAQLLADQLALERGKFMRRKFMRRVSGKE
jgi:hypothetical protein